MILLNAIRRFDIGCGALFVIILAGCGKPNPPPLGTTPPITRPEPASTSHPTTGNLKATVKFKDAAGQEAFSLKPKEDGAKLVDGQEQELARFNVSGDKLKIKDAQDQVLGYIVGSAGKYHVKDPTQETIWYEIQRQEDGDWKVEDGQEKLIYKIKRRDYGFEIEDDAETSIYKIKLKDGKLSLRNANDESIYYTHDPLPTLALVALGLNRIESLPLRSGIMAKLALDNAQ